MNKKPTIRDVAKHAGVSHAAVSYVLNGKNKVSEATKLKVIEAIKELNYYPDFTAVSLSKKQSFLIGVVLPLAYNSLALSMVKENHYYNEFIGGVELISRQNGFDILIAGVGNPEECINWVKKRNLDGLIFLGLFPDDFYKSLKSLSLPIVLIDTYEEYTDFYHNVRIDDQKGGYLATKHLIDLGHKNIAIVVTSLSSPVDQKRLMGYEIALSEANISLNKEFIFESHDITFEIGIMMGEKILKSKKKITSVFCVSDILAIGMVKGLQNKGKRIPEDYSIIGFDDLNISQYTTPSLTTIKQDINLKGKIAANTIINSIKTTGLKIQSKNLPVKLIKRESTKNLYQ